jgi:hypothetical protein
MLKRWKSTAVASRNEHSLKNNIITNGFPFKKIAARVYCLVIEGTKWGLKS